MTKSELIARVSKKLSHLPAGNVEDSVKKMLDLVADSLANLRRVEIRGFGSISLRYRKPRLGRNPKSGDSVNLDPKYVPHFKPGKELRERVEMSRCNNVPIREEQAGDDTLD